MDVTTFQMNNSLSLNDKINASIVSDDEFAISINTARWAMNFIATPILCIFGVVGNVLNIIVLRRCGYKDTNVLLLESLSLADLILSVVHSFLHAHYIVQCFDFVAASTFGTLSFIYLFVPYQTTLCVVQCHLVSIAAERVIAVYFPFHVVRIFSRPRVLMIIVVMYVFCIAVNFPIALVFESGSMHITDMNRTVAVVKPTQIFLENYDDMNNYMIMGLGILKSAMLPAITILGCAIVGFKLLRRKRQSLSRMKRKDAKNLKGMRLLTAVCVVSILFAISSVVMLHYYYVYRVFYGPFHELLLDITNLIGQFFSSTNFVIYVTMSNKFYIAYRKMICRF